METDTRHDDSADSQPVDLRRSQIYDRYRLGTTLGHGLGSEVILAKDQWLDAEVALKILQIAPGKRTVDSAERFLNEVRLARKLGHPNILRIFDFGQLSTKELFLSMEYCQEGSLQQLLDARPSRSLPFEQTISFILQLASALQHAHTSDVVHRDIKPANILLAADQKSIKLCDFGCANSIDLPAGLTRTGCIVGTPEYMAPEQFNSAELDGRTDIYALGILAFELASGRLPFVSDSVPQLMAAHISVQPPRLCELQPDIPAWFEEYVEVCLEKDPRNRFQSMDELGSLLVRRALTLDIDWERLYLPGTIVRGLGGSNGSGTWRSLLGL